MVKQQLKWEIGRLKYMKKVSGGGNVVEVLGDINFDLIIFWSEKAIYDLKIN